MGKAEADAHPWMYVDGEFGDDAEDADELRSSPRRLNCGMQGRLAKERMRVGTGTAGSANGGRQSGYQGQCSRCGRAGHIEAECSSVCRCVVQRHEQPQQNDQEEEVGSIWPVVCPQDCKPHEPIDAVKMDAERHDGWCTLNAARVGG